MPKRVVMLAHHFPPMAGSGANRALAFARYLPEAGWQPTVVTPGVQWASPRDDALAREIPSSVRVVRTRSFEAMPRLGVAAAGAVTAQPPNKLRANLGHLKRFPDAHLGWLPFAVAAARRTPYDVAYSSSGPFTSHVAGLVSKRISGKPWVAELRDGWYRWNRAIFPDYPRWRDALERRLEAIALQTADRVVLVTERMAAQFRCQYANVPASHFRVVSNGFDPTQFVAPLSKARQGGFSVVHSGALYYGRSVAAFLEAARRVSEGDSRFASEFSLTLLGSLDGAAQREVARSDLRVRIAGQVSHAESLAAMRSADLLLLVANTTPGAEATVPGKLFEYLAVGQPILAIAPPESSTADVLNQTGGGWLAAADDVSAIACTLERGFTQRTVQQDEQAVQRFNRRELTRELAAIFDELV
jgi:glycosyltransferase involved in cell wall biosynthesis